MEGAATTRASAAAWVAAAAGVGSLLAVLATAGGVAMVGDSTLYVPAARELAAGHGYAVTRIVAGEPTWHFCYWHPPGYPLVLAAFHRLGLDAFDAARVVGVVSLAASTLLIGAIVFRDARRVAPAALAAAAFALHPQVQQWHAHAMAEGLFILATLAALGTLAAAIERGRLGLFVAAGLLTGAAYLVKYAGLWWVGVGVGSILALGDRPGGRVVRTAAGRLVAFAASAAVAPLAWNLRNRLIDRPSLGREVGGLRDGYFSAELPAWLEILREAAWGYAWPLPSRATVSAGLLLALAAVGPAAWLLWTIGRSLAGPARPAGGRAAGVFAVAALVYVPLLVVANAIFDPEVLGNRRQLVMAYPLVLVAVATSAARLCGALAAVRATDWPGRLLAAAGATAAIWVVAAALVADVDLVPRLGRGEIRSRNPGEWRGSLGHRFAATLRPGAWVLTNGYRPAQVLRTHFDLFTGDLAAPGNAALDAAAVGRLRDRIARDGGGIVLLDVPGVGGVEIPPEEVAALAGRLGLRRVPPERGDAGAVWNATGERPVPAGE